MDRVALYIRLSEADDDVKNGLKDESNSITAQKALLHKFVREHKELCRYEAVEYFDDGLTGTGFLLRDSFQQMLDDAKKGLISCIVVKDFSRLGRDYLEVGNYMEFVFPTIGVRFISVNDNYDSDKNYGMTGGMDVAFKNLIYQLYSRDLSRKIKSARKNRNRNGEFTGPVVLYGYKRDPHRHNKLIIDEEAAETVKRIYGLYLDGRSIVEITHILNCDGIRTRTSYQEEEHGVSMGTAADDRLWCPTSVQDILTKEMYTGRLIQNRTKVVGFGDDKRIVECPQEEWTVVENGVPVIIPTETFEKVQDMLKSNRLKNVEKRKPVRKPMIYVCGHCGRRLSRKWSKRYECRMKDAVPDGGCSSVSVVQKKADSYVLDTVRELCSLCIEKENLASLSVFNGEKKILSVSELLTEKEKLEKSVVGLYKEYQSGKLSRESYIRQRSEISDMVADIDDRVQQAGDMADKNHSENKPDYEGILEKLTDEFDPYLMAELIDRVKVYGPEEMEIEFRNEDAFVV